MSKAEVVTPAAIRFQDPCLGDSRLVKLGEIQVLKFLARIETSQEKRHPELPRSHVFRDTLSIRVQQFNKKLL